MSIKRGEWPLDKVKAEAERLFQLAQEAYVRSYLPPEPDRERAEKLCVKMGPHINVSVVSLNSFSVIQLIGSISKATSGIREICASLALKSQN